MKLARLSVALASCILVFSTVAMAQEGAGAASRRAARQENRQEEMVAKITTALDTLNLTADQKTQVDKIMADHKAAMEAFRSQNGQEMHELTQQVRDAADESAKAAAQAKLEPLRKQRMELGKKLLDAVMAVLNPDQKAKLKEQVAEAHPRLAGALELGHVRQAIGECGLTENQRPKVEAIMKQAHADAKAATDPKAKQEVMEKAVTQIETTVLTKEQVTKFQEVMKEPLASGVWGKLNLTDDQKAKARDILKDAWTKAEENSDQRREIMRAANEKIVKDVLTPEQAEQLKKLRSARGGNASQPATN